MTDPAERLQLVETTIQVCLARDRPRLASRLRRLQREIASGKPRSRAVDKLAADAAASAQRRSGRLEALPRPTYPDDLPISTQRQRIADALQRHQVIVVCGETGSGKSTQLPKICLELGRGVDGMIAHTQPRRLAARTLASRVAEELRSEVGGAVGYKVRFTDRVSDRTHIKLLTDGMLLAEIQGDRSLLQYDTIIIDEAHERSLNIDFLLGYLKQLLPRRPDLKVIITSATIDPERFSRHFHDAPVIEVSGRSYPVEVRYRPLVSGESREPDRDMQTGILEAVEELAGEGRGDVLVFLPTERDIRETAEALRKRHPPHTEVLPLYARLSAAEQQKAFQSHAGRRIVLATNVAETSVTVPGIRYVVDTGQVRISRYSFRTKVQRLPIEPISRASADQRAGRCGRVAPGICIRLYSEEDYAARPAFTDPEILRTNLAAVILQMEAQRLGAVDDFPFVEGPDRRFVNDGYRLLHELGAVDADRKLTDTGRQLARLPLDPTIGRMLLAGAGQGALTEVLVIAAALSIQDPRERPLDAREAADQAHAVWKDADSDFRGFLNLWRDYREASGRLSRSKLRTWAREHYLSMARLRDWDDIHRQLREYTASMGLRTNTEPAAPAGIHKALLTGLVGAVAVRDEGDQYTGPRDLKLAIFPGSALAKSRPKWIMAGELVETSRVFARVAARTNPQDIEALAGHLLRRNVTEPHWDRKRGRVRAFETTSLYGLVLAARRPVDYARVDAADAREIFLRQGLAEDQVDSRGGFIEHNRRMIAEVQALEAKSRRRDVLVDVEARYAFFAARVPETVNDLRGFERWRRKAEAREPTLLHMQRDDLMAHDASVVTGERFPDYLRVGDLRLPLHYHFEPGDPADGVTVTVPIVALNQVRPADFEWLVPGLLEEKITAMIRGLPKRLRKQFVPAPDFARAVVESLPAGQGSLIDGLRRELQRMTGQDVSPETWDSIELPEHFRMRYRVVDGDGRELGGGRDLAVLQQRLAGHVGDAANAALPGVDQWARDDITRWDFGDIPESLEYEQHGIAVRTYPALEDRGTHVAQTLADSQAGAGRRTRQAVQRLLMLALRDQVKVLSSRITGQKSLQLQYAPLGGSKDLTENMLRMIVDRVFLEEEDVPTTSAAFRSCLDRHRGVLVERGEAEIARIGGVLADYHALRAALRRPRALDGMDSFRDMAEHLEALVFPDFLSALPPAMLDNLPRYLSALRYRLDKYPADPVRDAQRTRQIRPWWEDYLVRAERHRREGTDDPALLDFRLMLEEYRISLFAQAIGAAMPVSDKRLKAQWALVS